MINLYLASTVITNRVTALSKLLLGIGNLFRNLIWLVGAPLLVLSFAYDNIVRFIWLMCDE